MAPLFSIYINVSYSQSSSSYASSFPVVSGSLRQISMNCQYSSKLLFAFFNLNGKCHTRMQNIVFKYAFCVNCVSSVICNIIRTDEKKTSDLVGWHHRLDSNRTLFQTYQLTPE